MFENVFSQEVGAFQAIVQVDRSSGVSPLKQ